MWWRLCHSPALLSTVEFLRFDQENAKNFAPGFDMARPEGATLVLTWGEKQTPRHSPGRC
jgi:hypothetical protein